MTDSPPEGNAGFIEDELSLDKVRFKELERHIHKLIRFFEHAAPVLSKSVNPKSAVHVACGRLCSSQFDCLEAAIALSRAGKAGVVPMVSRRMFEQHVFILSIAFPISSSYSRSSMAWRYIAHGHRSTWRTCKQLRLLAKQDGRDPNTVISSKAWKSLVTRASAAKIKYGMKAPSASWYPYRQFGLLYGEVATAAAKGIIPEDSSFSTDLNTDFEEAFLWQYSSGFVHGGMAAVSSWINIDNDEEQLLQLNYAHNSGALSVSFLMAILSLHAFAHCIGKYDVLRQLACEVLGCTPDEFDGLTDHASTNA